jgi:hypothetical protein
MVSCSPKFLSEWREFPTAPFLCKKENNLMTARVSILLKSRASLDMNTFSLYNKKRLAIRHTNRPLFSNDTYQFRPTTSGSRSGYVLISIPSYVPERNCVNLQSLPWNVMILLKLRTYWQNLSNISRISPFTLALVLVTFYENTNALFYHFSCLKFKIIVNCLYVWRHKILNQMIG